jgi:hypothetical protein
MPVPPDQPPSEGQNRAESIPYEQRPVAEVEKELGNVPGSRAAFSRLRPPLGSIAARWRKGKEPKRGE